MKKLFLIIACLFSFYLQANVISDSIAYKKAHDAYKSGDFAQAQSAYTQLLSKNPYNAEFNYNLGCTLHKQKKYEDAQNYFNRAIERAEAKSKLQEQALFNRGNNFALQKKWDEAISDYEKVLKMNPENTAAQKNLKTCKEMKKQQQKQDQQKQKDKNKNQDSQKNDQQDQNSDSQSQDSKNQNSQNKDSSNQNSGDQSEQNQSSKDSEKEKKGKQAKDGKNDRQDEKGNAKNEGQKKEQRKQEQENGLEKSKDQKSKEKQEREKQEQEMKHDTSSKNSAQKQSNSSLKKGKDESAQEEVQLSDAYAQEMTSKPSDDQRLDEKTAMLLEKLDDYEKNIQKKLLQLNVTKQGAQKHGQKNW